MRHKIKKKLRGKVYSDKMFTCYNQFCGCKLLYLSPTILIID